MRPVMNRSRVLVRAGVLLLGVLSMVAGAARAFAEEGRHEPRAPLGFDLSKGWLDAWQHSDFSHGGTAYTHPVTLEPPYIDRALIVDFAVARGPGENGLELAAELEWGFTRRFAMAVEVPYVWLLPDGGEQDDGFADFSLAGRFLLVETERFLLSLQVEAAFPTGRREIGLSAEEVVLEPSLLAWVDLGAGFTLNLQAGYERGVESEETEVFYRAGLAWSVALRRAETSDQKAHAGHSHAAHPPRAGLLSFTAEYTGRTPLENEEEDEAATGEMLLGAIYSISENFDVRAGYLFPLGEPEELRDGWIFGATWHF